MNKFFLAALSCFVMMLGACSDKNTPEPQPNPDPEPEPEPGVEEVVPLKSIPFSKGLNLSDWFNVSEAYWFNPDVYTENDFDQLKSLGIDVVRLPINFPIFMGQAPAYTFDDKFLAALDNAVNWAEARGMYVILDQHSYYGSRVFPEGYGEELVTSGLRQLAMRYKGKDHVVLELFNEPGGSYIEKHWYEMQQRMIAEIRNIDKQMIIIATAVGCSYKRLNEIPEYNDKRMIYTFHFYTPFLFTHQGANWDNLAIEKIKNVPFPYDAASMPAMPDEFKGTEFEEYYNLYPAQGTEKFIGEVLMDAYSWALSNNKLLFCGEFGTLTTCPTAERAQWYKTVCDYFSAYGIAWTAWEYRDTKVPNFGIFKGANIFESNLDVELINAMGLTLPPGYENGCPQVIYFDDDIPFWWNQGGKWDGYEPKIDFMCKDKPYDGSLNCIRWDIDNIWGGLVMTSWPVADFTTQYNAGASLQFAIRTTDTLDKLVVRFTQYKTGALYQWRNMTEISTTDGAATAYQFANDGEWHIISIPLQKLWIRGTQGTWKDAPDEGEEGFAWDCINHLEIVPEGNNNVLGKTVYIDNIVIKK